ncbi:MAG: hypothetical protein E7459_08375 [Ruminococcaceae bacterium]|nr:hypothetical protein [Oscillospiraceae bacterium]
MAPAVAVQGQWFLWAIPAGAALALVYHFLRGLRHTFPVLTIPADMVFLLCTAWVIAALALVVCQGAFRMPQVLGLLAGAWVYRVTAFRLLEWVFSGFWRLLGRIFGVIGRACKKSLKKIGKIGKFLFSSWKKWVTIKRNKVDRPFAGGNRYAHTHKVSSNLTVDQTGHSGPADFLRRTSGVPAVSAPGQRGKSPGAGSAGRRTERRKSGPAGRHRRSGF